MRDAHLVRARSNFWKLRLRCRARDVSLSEQKANYENRLQGGNRGGIVGGAAEK
jgi:hypothetical protein